MTKINKILSLLLISVFLFTTVMAVVPVKAQTLETGELITPEATTLPEATPSPELTELPGSTVTPIPEATETATPENTALPTEALTLEPTASPSPVAETTLEVTLDPTAVEPTATATPELTVEAPLATETPSLELPLALTPELIEETVTPTPTEDAAIQAVVLGDPVAPAVPSQECKVNTSGQSIVAADFSAFKASSNGTIDVRSIDDVEKTVTLFVNPGQSVVRAYMSFNISGAKFDSFTANSVNAKISADGSRITLFVASLSSDIQFTVKVSPDAGADSFTITSAFYSGISGCKTNITLTEPFSDCSVAWHASAFIDPSLDDLANSGYTYKVSCEEGYLAVHHWADIYTDPNATRDILYFRIPVGTLYALTNGSLKLTPSPNFAIVDGPVTVYPHLHPGTGQPWFPLMTNNPNFSEDSKIRSAYIQGGVLYFGDMPAKSGAMFQFALKPTDGRIDPGDIFTLDADLYGNFLQTDDNPHCGITVPPAPELADEVCKLNLAGQTVFPLTAHDISARTKIGSESLGEINADGWGGGSTRYLRLYAATREDVHNAVITFFPTQGFSFAEGSMGKVFTYLSAQDSGAMGMLDENGYIVPATEIGTPVINPDGSLTLVVGKMPANSAIAFTVVATLDGSGKAIVMNSTYSADLDVCTVPGSLSGNVFHDLNEDGLLDTGDKPIGDYQVTVTDANDVKTIVKTNPDGSYSVPNLPPGTYTVTITVVDPYSEATTVTTYTVVVEPAKETKDINFGLILPPAPIVTAVSPTPTDPAPTQPSLTPTPSATPQPNPTTTAQPTATQKAAVVIPYTGDSNNMSGYLGIMMVFGSIAFMMMKSSFKAQKRED